VSEVVIYQDEQNQTGVSVRLDGETVWLTQRQMADLFDTSADNVSLHLKNIFLEGELGEPATTEDFSVVQTEGRRKVTRTVRHYNLDAIISVGYRVNSKRGVQFRQWATRVLREHLVRGYSYNQTRLAERGLLEARQTLDLLARTLQNQALVDDTGRAVLDLIVSPNPSSKTPPSPGWRGRSATRCLIHGPDLAVRHARRRAHDPNYRDVVLDGRLRHALVRLNPTCLPRRWTTPSAS
jgi:hypothetical protein